MLRIQSRTDVYVKAAVTALLSAVVAGCVVSLVFPPEEWGRVAPFTLCVTITIALVAQVVTNFQVLEIGKQLEEARSLVARDALTNVATRRFFFERMSMAPKASGAVLVVDIDHFKSVNDTYGHQVGDEALRRVAGTLSLLCRGQDMVCRFGGEEFVVFIFDADTRGALGMAEILREAVAHEPIPSDDGPFCVTISVGVAIKEPGDEIGKILGDADEALYVAKNSGRNRISFSGINPELEQADMQRAAGE